MKTIDKRKPKTLAQPVVKLKIKAPVAKAPVAKAPIAKAPIAKAPIAKAPVAKAPIAKTGAPTVVGVARAPIVRAESQTKKASKAAPAIQKSSPVSRSEKVAPTAKSSVAKTPVAKAPAAKAPAAKYSVAKAPVVSKASVASPSVATRKAGGQQEAGVPKAKRTRVPADLAAQYGERMNLKAEARPVVEEAKPRRPRRDAAARAKLKELLRPDETLVERLARANTVSLPKRTPTRRSKNWRTRCGKCGTEGNFAVAAALCSRCGTILIRAD